MGRRTPPVPSPMREAKKRNAKMRLCLSCNSEFESAGPGNRICPGCHRNKDDFMPHSSRKTARAGRAIP